MCGCRRIKAGEMPRSICIIFGRTSRRRCLKTSQFDLYIFLVLRRGAVVGWAATEDGDGHLFGLLMGSHTIDIPGFPRACAGSGGLDSGGFIGFGLLSKSWECDVSIFIQPNDTKSSPTYESLGQTEHQKTAVDNSPKRASWTAFCRTQFATGWDYNRPRSPVRR